MNPSLLRLPLRLAVPMIALAALVAAGEPVSASDDAVLSATPATTLELACDDLPAHEAEVVEANKQRRHTAMRLRWAVTLPHSLRPVSFSVMP